MNIDKKEYCICIKWLTIILFLNFTISAPAQDTISARENAAYFHNRFQYYTHKCVNESISIDSSIYFARRLAAHPRYISYMQELIHNSFSQIFQPQIKNAVKNPEENVEFSKRLKTATIILKRMVADANQQLSNSAKPIYLWYQVQEHQNHDEKLRQYANEFLNTQLFSNDIYPNRIARYALLIYQIISTKPALMDLSQTLFDRTFNILKTNEFIAGNDNVSKIDPEKRAWFRYLYAYCNYMQAKKLMEAHKENMAGNWFKVASDYSPDLTDKNNFSAYCYDMIFLFNKEKRSFANDYLTYLTRHSKDSTQTLNTLLKMAFSNPQYKKELRSFYISYFSRNGDFDIFWLKELNKSMKDAPEFRLKQLDGTEFSLNAYRGKWILIDFWGTWCAPCIKELPAMQKFYDRFIGEQDSTFALLTIACSDTENKVQTFMSKNKYTFPVAMSDGKIEIIYAVNSYPTKVLISPQGKYTIIPFGEDWKSFIKSYSEDSKGIELQ